MALGAVHYFLAEDMKAALRLINRLQIEAISTGMDVDSDQVEIDPDCLAVHDEATKFIEEHRDTQALKIVSVSFADGAIPDRCVMVPCALPAGTLITMIEDAKKQAVKVGQGEDYLWKLLSRQGVQMVYGESVVVGAG